MGHHETIHLTEERYVMTSRTRNFALGLLGIGLILTIIGIFMAQSGSHHEEHHALVSAGHEVGAAAEHHGPTWVSRVWANLLLNSYYALIIAVSGTFFIAINYLANAGWAVGLKRIPEAMGMYLPVGFVFVLIATLFGAHDLYHWTHEDVATTDEAIKGKSPFLNKGMLYGGFTVIVGIFFYFHTKLRNLSHKEDTEGGLNIFNKSVRISAAYTFIFAFAFSTMSWIIVMSIDPHFFSTIYSIYNFAISFVCGLTVMLMLTLFLKSEGYLTIINKEHIHDLGKFIFAFSIFWTYIWLAQYLLIWYANIPEESVYFVERLDGNGGRYQFQFWLNLFLCFVAPFFGLMTRESKRSTTWLYIIGTIILIGHWNDLYLIVMPGIMKDQPGLGLLELGMPLFFAGLFIFVVLKALERAPLFPMKHPYLEESVHHDVGV